LLQQFDPGKQVEPESPYLRERQAYGLGYAQPRLTWATVR
jgi:hypothetical protein